MLAIYAKELKSYLNSLIAYLVIILFLVFTGLVVWVFPNSNILDYGYADLGSFFLLAPFILLFLAPAITMRSFAEESKTGTLELLFTLPISSQSLVWGKLLAAWSLIIIAIIPTLIYVIITWNLGLPEGNIDLASTAGSYVGLFLLGLVFTSVGVFISSISSNQIVAFLLAAFLCYFWLDGLHQLAGLFSGKVNYYLDYFSLQYHYNSLSRGVIDSRNVLFLLSVVVLLTIATVSILSKKKK